MENRRKSCLASQGFALITVAPDFESINKLQIVYGMQINQISFSIKPASQEPEKTLETGRIAKNERWKTGEEKLLENW